MKKLVLSMVLMGTASVSHAKTHVLECTTGRPYQVFRAVLDDSSYQPGSGFFSVTGASIIDNYATARLICSGHQISEITCVGFWFDVGSQVAEIKTKLVDDVLTAAHKSLTRSLVGPSADWPCTIK